MPTYSPKPGTIGLSKIHGTLGFLIALAQLLCGHTSLFTHAFVVLDNDEVLEAMPTGARIRPLKERLDWEPVCWGWTIGLTDADRARIVGEARKLVGVPYSFVDYLSLALLHLGPGRGVLGRWVEGRVRSSGHMICSQLVDEVYNRAGIEIFDDGRYPGDVMPGTLANALVHPKWYREV